jgi:tetratricopeptide (TPR) repeat protein
LAADRSKVLQQAQLLASRGQYDAAIAEWKKLAAESPNDGGIQNSIGDLHLKRNAGTDAITSFMQAAAAFRAEGATLKAIAAFKKVLKIDPTRYEVYRHLGDLNAERGLLSSAVQDYLTLGKHYLKEGKTKEALDIYKKIVSQDPSNLDAQQRVAELCVQENLQDEATKVYLQLGRERSAQGRYDEAKDAYLAVLRIDPKNNEAAQFVESVQKGGAGALKAPALTVAHKSSEPLDLLAEATRRIEEKQYAGAEAILNQLLTREPGNPEVCQLLARLHLQRGDVQVALGEYRFLAGAALRAQDYLLAEALIREFLSAEPHSVPLLELYGELLAEKGDAAAAAQRYAQAVELLLQHPEPGMESLHEELFDKVKALSTDRGLVSRLAAKMAGETPPQESGIVTQEPPEAQLMDAAVMQPLCSTGVASDEVAQGVESGPFKLEDESPDGSDGLDSLPPRTSIGVLEILPAGQGAPLETSVGWSEGVPAELLSKERAHSKDSAAAPQETPAVAEETVDAASLIPADIVDYEAHFTLGVAFKNMGLYSEARQYFEVSKKSDLFFVDSCLMTALCLKEEKLAEEAIQELEGVLVDARCQGAKGQAIRYELGLLYEAAELWDKAVNAYHAIPSFHDVPQRLQSLEGRSQPALSEFRLAG